MPAAALRGIVPALITPLDESGEVDEASIHSLIDFQIDAGVHGLFVLGSTGEGPLLTSDQKVRVVRATVEAARGRLPVMVGIAHSSPAESAAFGRQAQAAGANALVMTAPFYFAHSQPEVLNAFRYVAERVAVPLIAYDVPSAVKVKLTAATVRTMAEEGLAIGIKDSSGDMAGFRDLVLATEHRPSIGLTSMPSPARSIMSTRPCSSAALAVSSAWAVSSRVRTYRSTTRASLVTGRARTSSRRMPSPRCA
jgi:4-hydroxy-tetrahydrodipicolinate synthase